MVVARVVGAGVAGTPMVLVLLVVEVGRVLRELCVVRVGADVDLGRGSMGVDGCCVHGLDGDLLRPYPGGFSVQKGSRRPPRGNRPRGERRAGWR